MKKRITEKIIYKGTPWKLLLLISFLASLITAITVSYFQSQPIFPEPEQVQYPVYKVDPEITAKLSTTLTACQDSWKEDQTTMKLLRMKIKRLEAYGR